MAPMAPIVLVIASAVRARSSRAIDLDAAYDEMFEPTGRAAGALPALFDDLRAASHPRARASIRSEADKAFLTQGITFTVYGDDAGHRAHLSRTICCRASSRRPSGSTLERGLTQRLTAINLFLKDVYHDGRILAEGIVPRELVHSCRHYRREMRGVHVHRDIYVSVAGTDLVRLDDGRVRRARRQPARAERRVVHAREPRGHQARPAGARSIATTWQPDRSLRPGAARDAARAGAAAAADPTFVVLTPGVGNSAYFEHAFLAREMGVALVEGRDLLVHDNVVYMRTTAGLKRVDVIYRRVDDDFLDPLAFRARLASRRRGTAERVSRRQRVARQCDRHRRRRRQGAVRLHPGDHQVLSVRGADSSERRDVPAAATRPTARYVLEHLDSLVVKAVGESAATAC